MSIPSRPDPCSAHGALHCLGRAVSLVLLAILPARHAAGDEAAARVLGAVRRAVLAGPRDEAITIEVRGPEGVADVSEGRLWLDLASVGPTTPHGGQPEDHGQTCLDLTVGPVRVVATRTSLSVVHATDPDQYVGVSIDGLTFPDLERVIPTLPLPQVAIAIAPEQGDLLHIPSLMPPIRLREVSRGQTKVTLAGQAGSSSVTMIVSLHDDRIERFEAIVPAPSGWYELIVTMSPVPDDWAPRVPLDVQGRERVTQVADLRPRGLVLVPGAEIGWLPVVPHDRAPASPTTLGGVLRERGPMVVGLVEYRPPDAATTPPAWIEHAAALATTLDRVRGDGWSMLLVFDPSGRGSVNRQLIEDALHRVGLDATPWAWVDGRSTPLDRALPRLDPGVMVVSSDGTIADATRMPDDDRGRGEWIDRLRAALGRSR